MVTKGKEETHRIADARTHRVVDNTQLSFVVVTRRIVTSSPPPPRHLKVLRASRTPHPTVDVVVVVVESVSRFRSRSRSQPTRAYREHLDDSRISSGGGFGVGVGVGGIITGSHAVVRRGCGARVDTHRGVRRAPPRVAQAGGVPLRDRQSASRVPGRERHGRGAAGAFRRLGSPRRSHRAAHQFTVRSRVRLKSGARVPGSVRGLLSRRPDRGGRRRRGARAPPSPQG